MNQVVTAGLWGSLSGSALLIGAIIGYAVRLPQRVISTVMAVGAGVLLSAVAFDLMDHAIERGGLGPTAAGLMGGAIAYTAANLLISRMGARHRKRSGSNAAAAQASGAGLALAIGALLDGVPESVVIGVGLLEGAGVSMAMVAAVFLSNLPEGLSSAAGMRNAGKSKRYVFGVWGGIAVASGAASAIGNLTLGAAAPELIAIIIAVAAGAILTMLVDTMIPEATEDMHETAGLITTASFLAAFALSKLGG